MMRPTNWPKTKGFFITGTDTGVGKTMVTGAIANYLKRKGINIGVFKPIATGCERRREGLVSPDAEFLAYCADSPLSLEQINPVRYAEPLAPWVAADRAAQPVDWEAIRIAYQNVVDSSEAILVEGVGGVMVPLEKDYFVLDLMAELRLPVVIVTRADLGTINHTLLTVNACKSRDLKVIGLVINGYNPDEAGVAEETNLKIISELSGCKLLAVIPYDQTSCVERLRLEVDIISAISTIFWAEFL